MQHLIEFLYMVGKLKKLKRTGWVRNGVPNAESVAEHSFRTAIAAYLVAESEGLDKEKCLKMGLIHDLAEAVVGDITPYDNVTAVNKHKMEKDALERMLNNFNNKEIFDLWLEYEARKTPEAKLVYEIDKIEMLVQAVEYEREHGVDLNDFWKMWGSRLTSSRARELYNMLMNQRNIVK